MKSGRAFVSARVDIHKEVEKTASVNKTKPRKLRVISHVGADRRLIEALTKKECELLALLVRGSSNKEMALILDVSEHTIKFHLKNIYSKLSVNTRLQAIKATGEIGVLSKLSFKRPFLGGVAS